MLKTILIVFTSYLILKKHKKVPWKIERQTQTETKKKQTQLKPQTLIKSQSSHFEKKNIRSQCWRWEMIKSSLHVENLIKYVSTFTRPQVRQKQQLNLKLREKLECFGEVKWEISFSRTGNFFLQHTLEKIKTTKCGFVTKLPAVAIII